jgi:hypothetical protein
MPQKPARKKLLITRNAGPPSPMSARCRTLPPYEAYGVRITRRCHCPIFFTQGGPHSPPKSPRTPEMLLGSMQGYITPCTMQGPGLTQRTHSHFGCGSRGNHLGDRVGSPGFTQ